MELPVYLFTGFLESGKTTFIQETLEDPRFYDGERTLVIMCEEGEAEFEPQKYPCETVFFHKIEDISELTQKNLLALVKKYRMHRVLIEYNGMWLLDKLYEALPNNWLIYQNMMFADSTTILSYNQNMRSLVGDKLKDAQMVIFNRVKSNDEFMALHKLVRGVNRGSKICYEFVDGQIEHDEIEDPLPFDINADFIDIKDIDYALWYSDLMENTDRYVGKTVRFKGIVVNDDKLPADCFAIGRHIMTCCEDDIAYGGLLAKFDDASNFETRDWVVIEAVIKNEYTDLYASVGPVLYATNVMFSLPPEVELAMFY